MTDKIDHEKYGPAEEFEAKQLSQEDLGKLVMVTLPSGATIQDILVAVLSHADYKPGSVLVVFKSVKSPTQQGYTEGAGSWELEPDSPVWAETHISNV